MRPGGLALFPVLGALALLAACATSRPDEGAPDERVPADYDTLVEAFNERAEQIESIWAPAIVDVEFTEEDGGTNWEQGNGRFQFRQPDSLSLNVGKLGTNWFWVGCNADLYWIFDLREDQQILYFGRNAANGRLAATRLGWPVVPRELVVLAGNSPIPDAATLRERGMTGVAWSRPVKERVFLEWRRNNVRTTRFVLENDTMLPIRVVLFNDAGDPVVRAELSNHDNLPTRGAGGDPPDIARRYVIRNLETGDEVRIRLDTGLRGDKRISDKVFDLEALAETLGITRVVDLDAPAEATP